ncbi:MAG: hypothetical protein AAF604_15705 [Acidobacteriota bacterium]
MTSLNELCRLLQAEVPGSRAVGMLEPATGTLLAHAERRSSAGEASTVETAALAIDLLLKVGKSLLLAHVRQELDTRRDRQESVRKLVTSVGGRRLFLRSMGSGRRVIFLVTDGRGRAEEVWEQIERTSTLAVALSGPPGQRSIASSDRFEPSP